MYVVQESILDTGLSSADQSGISTERKANASSGRLRLATLVICTTVFLGFIIMAMTVALVTLTGESDTKDDMAEREERGAVAELDLEDATELPAIVPEIQTQVAPITTRSSPVPSTAATTTRKLVTTTSTTEATTQQPTTTTTTSTTTTATTSTTTTTTTTTTERSTVRTTTRRSTSKATTSAKTRPTTLLPSTATPKKDAWVSLLCTIGTKLDDPQKLPVDGVCNYLVYDSVYKKGPTAFDPSHVDIGLTLFLGVGSQMNKTILSIAFAYEYRQYVKSQLTTTGGTIPGVVKYFLDQNICTFGIVDTPTNTVDKSSVEEMLEILKVLRGFTVSHGTSDRRCLTIFASSPTEPNSDTIYVDAFSKIFTPDVVVMLSHYAEADNTFEDCRVVPPTMLQRPVSIFSNSSYKNDMHKAADTLRKLTLRGVVASWLLSVTMKGRWTVLKPGQPVDFLSECVHDPSAESFGSYAEVCEHPDFSDIIEYKARVRGKIFYSQSGGRMFSYDNGTTFIEKLCRVRVLQLTFTFGIAAFDLDYDDYANICDKLNHYRAFTRLYTLTDLLEYFQGVFHDAGELEDCLDIAQ